MLGSLENSTLWYLTYKNIFYWLKPVPCGNVLMWSLKHVRRNAVNTYSSLSGFYLVRNTQELCLSACGLPHCLPLAFKSGLAVFNEAEVAELGGHHQHCSSRGKFPSDKSLSQPPCSEAQTPHPCHLIIHLQKNMVSTQWAKGHAQSPHAKLRLTSNPHYKEFPKKEEKAVIKDNLFIIYTMTDDLLIRNKSFWRVLFNIN